MTLKVGADPEFFLQDRKTKKFMSAHGVIPGTKFEPHPVPCGAVQVDGMALEFNIDPAEDQQTFIHNINEVMTMLQGMLPKNFDLTFEAAVHFDKTHLKKQPRAALELGCEPDFDAYSGDVNDPPDQHATMRTAAGHIHVGWREPKEEVDYEKYEEARAFTRQLDFILGVPSLLLDTDNKRREMYGKAGSFRPKKYGLEYRVLSNFWLQNNKLMEWAFKNTHKAFKLLVEDGVDLFTRYGELAKDIINGNNKEDAESFYLNELQQYVCIEDTP